MHVVVNFLDYKREHFIIPIHLAQINKNYMVGKIKVVFRLLISIFSE